jgi:hypothetical protein
VIAEQVGAGSVLPSLQLGIEGGGSTGSCDSGYSCAYQRNISWSGPATPLPKLTDPRDAFDRMFAGFDPNASAAEQQRRKLYRTSVLDVVRGEATALSVELGAQDRPKLEEYLTAVRQLEQKVAQSDSFMCQTPIAPVDPAGRTDHIDVMFELMAIALQCRVTRVITFMMANSGSNHNYDFIGASGAHHEISHHGGDPANHEKLKKIDRWEVERLAKFVARLKGMADADGQSVLDNTAVFFSSEISDGDRHNHNELPALLVGGLGGAIRTGRHVMYEEERYFGNLFVSLARAFGANVDRFGDRGEGPLESLV